MGNSVFSGLVHGSLQNRLVVAAVALWVTIYGSWQISHLPIDVFPDLNRPRVVVMTEAPGLAPEEVETLITFPLETALNGANGVEEVRSTSGVGMSVIYVEFGWNTDIYNDRQVVAERLALASERLPSGVRPQLAPISSVMGQILIAGMFSTDNTTSPQELRTLADWVVRQQILTIPGVAQVFVMGGDRKQYQVLVNPNLLTRYGVTLHDVIAAVGASNQNATGGYLQDQGPNELLVRVVGRVHSIRELEQIVVTYRDGRSILLGQVARIQEGPQVKRGSSAAYVADGDQGFTGGPAVVLTVNKQPDADTEEVTRAIDETFQRLQSQLPPDVRLVSDLYRQQAFIDLAIENVVAALRDGGILVVIVLFLFLLNLRVTLVTLTAIPLSLVTTGLIFQFLGLSVNTMTLGGLAVAIGELVDDAIVDVENILRRLRENAQLPQPQSPLTVVFRASMEIRNSIVYGTLIVVLVFIPLFALSGLEGRLFTPLGVAYIASISASLLVSLTVTPVLSYWLLGRMGTGRDRGDGLLLRGLKRVAAVVVRTSLRFPGGMLIAATAALILALALLLQMDRDFLPPFDEGAVQVNALLPPGTSLKESERVAKIIEQRLLKVPEIVALVRKTGRAELDEHAEGVNVSEFVASLDPETYHRRAEVLNGIRQRLEDIPGVLTSVEQPLTHLISHMLSGVKAQVAIKIYGDDLERLRAEAEAMRAAIRDIPGVTDLQVEQQTVIPQLRIEPDAVKLVNVGLKRAEITELVEDAMQGRVVSQVINGQRRFDLLVRLDEPFREDLESLKRLPIHLPGGGTIKLDSVARLYPAGGPNQINREQVRRRMVVQCNTSGRGTVDVVEDIRSAIAPIERELPQGYSVEIGGQFASHGSAARTMLVLSGFSVAGIFLILCSVFRSPTLALQVMVALPTAFLGGVLGLLITGQALTVAAMVGFVSLSGIAARNGILLVNHYLHLVREEGESWSKEMIVRASLERLAPVLMTALTSGIGLLPLLLAPGEPGKEMLYPVATVIVGGLVSCTMLEFLVRPALFWKYGIQEARRVVQADPHGERVDPVVGEQRGPR